MSRPHVIHKEVGEHQWSECSKCHSDVDWQDCTDCGDGASYHDCGEDCCSCLYPEPNVVCDTCDGKGGWYQCLSCGWLLPKPTKEDEYIHGYSGMEEKDE